MSTVCKSANQKSKLSTGIGFDKLNLKKNRTCVPGKTVKIIKNKKMNIL